MTQEVASREKAGTIQRAIASIGAARLIILAFMVALFILGAIKGISVTMMLGNILRRTGMYGVMVLAILPGIQCGIGLNLGMTVGVIAGLLSTLLCIEFGLTGLPAFVFAVAIGCLIALPIGYLYGLLLNRLKGNEMTVSTYVGFSFVSLFCIAWMMLPFQNTVLKWVLGPGLRVTHNMSTSFGDLLNNFLAFRIGDMVIPTGLLLFFLFTCLLMWLFSRSKTGAAMIAAGANPRFAEATGINVDKMRLIGTILSTMLASVGIIVYAQSFGFLQLYTAPRQMGFIAASAILIGGASVTKAKISNVIFGTFLFHGVLAMGTQVANRYISGGGLSEAIRILISNGIILYALTKAGGDSRE